MSVKDFQLCAWCGKPVWETQAQRDGSHAACADRAIAECEQADGGAP